MNAIRNIVQQIQSDNEKKFCVLIFKILTHFYNNNLDEFPLQKWLYGQLNWFCLPQNINFQKINFQDLRSEIIKFLFENSKVQNPHLQCQNVLAALILINQLTIYSSNIQELDVISLFHSVKKSFYLGEFKDLSEEINIQNMYNLLINAVKGGNLYKIRQILFLMNNEKENIYQTLKVFSLMISTSRIQQFNCKHIATFINEIQQKDVLQAIDKCQINSFTLIFFIQLCLSYKDHSFYQQLLGQNNQLIYNYIFKFMKIGQYTEYQITQQILQQNIYQLLNKLIAQIKTEQEFIRKNQLLFTSFKMLDLVYQNNLQQILSNDIIDKNIRNLMILIQNQIDNTVVEQVESSYQKYIENLPNNRYIIQNLPIDMKINKIFQLLSGLQDIQLQKFNKNLSIIYVDTNNTLMLINNAETVINISPNIKVIDDIFRNKIFLAEKANAEKFTQKTIQTDKQLIQFCKYGKYLIFHSLFGFIYNLDTQQVNQHLFKLLQQLNQEFNKNINQQILQQITIALQILCQTLIQDEIAQSIQKIIITEFIFQIFQNKQQKKLFSELIVQIYFTLFDNFKDLTIEQTCLDKFYQQYNQVIDQIIKNIQQYRYNYNNLSYLLIDPQIQRYPFEQMLNYTVRANIVKKAENKQENKQYEYYIDPRLPGTKQTLLPVLKQWTRINDLNTFIPEQSQLFYYGGHGTANIKAQHQNNMPSSILMGCSSLVEVYINRFCTYENRLIYNTAPFAIGCIYDMLGSELDTFSKSLLQLIDKQKDNLSDQIIYQLVKQSKQKINLQGLVASGIVLYCKIEL